jgi:carboxymethylenebutenolidase
MLDAIRTGRGTMPAYVAVPGVPPPWPGVVVVHDFTGMSRDLRDQADWLAGEGFLAVAPDLYYWGSRLGCLRTIMRDLGQRRGRSFDDIEAARGWLRGHPECTGQIGVIGFCMGGGYAVALAADRGFDAASVNYGGCPSDAEEWLPDACPIVGSFGGSDSSPLGGRAGRRLGRLLTELEVPHDVKIYPGVGHGFMNNHDHEDQTLLLRFLARISGTEYDEDATRDARRRIIEFFNRYLTGASDTWVLELSHTLDATREQVFNALVDPAELVKWWGPSGFTTPEIEVDLRVGGDFRLGMQPPDGELFHLVGTFREIDPPNRLVYTFRWEEPDPDDRETVVTLSLVPLDDRTRLSLQHAGFMTEARLELHRGGWADSLQRLVDHLARAT